MDLVLIDERGKRRPADRAAHTNRHRRKWPKPFTPEEERYRQQVGVQAFINYQHELTTGQKRSAEQ